jgi:hypothetical protein
VTPETLSELEQATKAAYERELAGYVGTVTLRMPVAVETLAYIRALERALEWNVYVAFADAHPDFPAFKDGWDRVPEDKAWKP